MASLESSTLKRTGRSYDFSEINLAVNNDLTGHHDGGNDYITTNYLSRWKGPVDEVNDLYPSPATPVSLTAYEQGNSYEIYFEPNYELNGFKNIMINKEVILMP